MALTDVVARIEADAEAEARRIVGEAETRAEASLASVRTEAERAAARTIERGEALARAEAETLRAGARLVARDREIEARRALVARGIESVAEGLAGLSAGRYTAFIAAGIARAARGGERVLVAPADRERLAGLRAAVEDTAPDLELTWDGGEADTAAGVVLLGDRVRAEVSVASTIAERRADIEENLSRLLFGGGLS